MSCYAVCVENERDILMFLWFSQTAIAAYFEVIPGRDDASTMGRMRDLASETEHFVKNDQHDTHGEEANGNEAASRDEVGLAGKHLGDETQTDGQQEDPQAQEGQDEDTSDAEEYSKFSLPSHNQDEVGEADDHEGEKASDDRKGQEASQPALWQEVDATENTEKADDSQDVGAKEDVAGIEQEQQAVPTSSTSIKVSQNRKQ